MKKTLLLSICLLLSLTIYARVPKSLLLSTPICSNGAITVNVEADSLIQKNDTLGALSHLFERKRRGGTIRAIVCGLLTGSSLGAAISTGFPGNYLGAGIFGVLTITGITQVNKYSKEQLQIILKDATSGKPIPLQYKNKLKAKDFKHVSVISN